MFNHVKLHPKMMSFETSSLAAVRNLAERAAKLAMSKGGAGAPSEMDLGFAPWTRLAKLSVPGLVFNQNSSLKGKKTVQTEVKGK